MRRLGVDALILANRTYLEYARLAYHDVDEVFVEFATHDDVERLSRGREVLIATHFKSMSPVAAVWQRRQDFLPVYYVQDYEPFFTVNVNGGAPESLEARSSYDAIPDALLFAKTHWICNAVGRVRGLPVAKIEPGIDERLFHATKGALRPSGPVRVLGMVRPRTWRRQPFATLVLLDRLQAELGDAVEVGAFGCTDEALELMAAGRQHGVPNHGILTREEIADRLRETDVFLDVSAFQGMGRTGFEGMCCGCTPIMPIIGGAHEFAVHDETAVLVDSSDLESCYRDLRELVLDRPRIARLQAAGVRAGQRRSVLAAVLSEYAIIEFEHGRRFGRPDTTTAPDHRGAPAEGAPAPVR
jgi:glycosyltransferase involved in cell wall biosynthesis